VPSGLAVSPTGAYTAVAVSYDDVVKVIDNSTNTVVSTLTVGDYPVCIAFDATGDYAVVTNYFSNNYSVMRIAGDSSSVVGTFACGAGPLRLALNPYANEIGIATLTAKTLVCVNPQTGAQTRSFSYSSYGSPTDVRFGENNEPIVLTGGIGDFYGHVHRGSDHVVLPGPPTQLDYAVSRGIAAVSMPGPDFVTLIAWPMGVADQRTISTGRPGFTITPNPARTAVTVHLTARPLGHLVTFRVYDASGRLVLTTPIENATGSSLSVDVSGLPAGTYVCRLSGSGATATRPLVVTR
jgi:YVTN family beta-propeller protein